MSDIQRILDQLLPPRPMVWCADGPNSVSSFYQYGKYGLVQLIYSFQNERDELQVNTCEWNEEHRILGGRPIGRLTPADVEHSLDKAVTMAGELIELAIQTRLSTFRRCRRCRVEYPPELLIAELCKECAL